jgi:hypothetical protein
MTVEQWILALAPAVVLLIILAFSRLLAVLVGFIMLIALPMLFQPITVFELPPYISITSLSLVMLITIGSGMFALGEFLYEAAWYLPGGLVTVAVLCIFIGLVLAWLGLTLERILALGGITLPGGG